MKKILIFMFVLISASAFSQGFPKTTRPDTLTQAFTVFQTQYGTFGVWLDSLLSAGVGSGGTTDLSTGTRTSTTFPINNSNGTGVTIDNATIEGGTNVAGLMTPIEKGQMTQQTIAYSATISANLNNGNRIYVDMTGDAAIAAPSNSVAGEEITYILTANGANRTATFASVVFKEEDGVTDVGAEVITSGSTKAFTFKVGPTVLHRIGGGSGSGDDISAFSAKVNSVIAADKMVVGDSTATFQKVLEQMRDSTTTEVDSIQDLLTLPNLSLKQVVRVRSLGSYYRVESSAVTGYTTDSVAVVPNGSNFLVLQIPANGIDVRVFGAKDVANYFVRKNPIPPSTPTASDYSDIYFKKAIDYLNTQTAASKTNPRRLLIEGQYYIDTLTLEPVNGVELWCVGNSYLHYNALDTCINLVGHYGMEHKINVSHRTWIGTTTRLWYPTGVATLPVDSTSIGVRVENSRNNTIYISSLKFMTGILLQGDADGNVNNVFYPGDISNNRYNIRTLNINGGWSNQNTFIGGKVNGTGLVGRNYAVDIDCAYVQLNSADNTTFVGVNFEGSTNYKYCLYVDGPYNNFINCRFEGVRANQIVFTSDAQSSKISGYGASTIVGQSNLPLYYSSAGSEATLPKLPDGGTVTGFIFRNIGDMPMYETAGSLWLPGADYIGVGRNSTLTLESKANTSNSKLLEAQRDEKIVLSIVADGNVNYYGPSGLSQLQRATNEATYDTITYSAGNWVSRGKFIDDSGTIYYARRAFQCDGTIANDVTAGNLVLNSGETIPAVTMRDNGIDAEQIGGIQNLSGVTVAPKFIDALALELETPISVSGTYTLAVTEKSIARLNPTTNTTVTFDMTNVSEGTIFALTHGVSNTASLIITAGGTVKSIEGTDIVIGYREVCYFQYAFNIVQEIGKTSGNFRQVGTTAQRPTLTTAYTNYLYFDTTLGAWIRWNGTAWVTTSYAGLPVASETQQGIVELATAAETAAGIDNTRAVTPAGLNSVISCTDSTWTNMDTIFHRSYDCSIDTSLTRQMQLTDADSDTKIQVEESADEDIIRLDAGGNEVAQFYNTRIDFFRRHSVFGSGALNAGSAAQTALTNTSALQTMQWHLDDGGHLNLYDSSVRRLVIPNNGILEESATKALYMDAQDSLVYVNSSGTWTPTLTLTGTDTVVVNHGGTWSRSGNTVTYSLSFAVGLPSTAQSNLHGVQFTLPVSSTLTSHQIKGTTSMIETGDGSNIAFTAGDDLTFQAVVAAVSNDGYLSYSVTRPTGNFNAGNNRFWITITGNYTVN